MKAVITVTAKDAKGIIAKVSAKVSEYEANIIDISQSVVGEYFAMIMLVEFDARRGFRRICGRYEGTRRAERSHHSSHARGYFQLDAPNLSLRGAYYDQY